MGLPLLEPIFLLDPASSFLRPEGPPGSQEGRPQSYTSRRVRHCLGSLFWYRWQQVLLGLLWVSLLRLGSRVGWGWASRASSDPTHSEMLRDRSMWGRRCQFGDAALRRCLKGQKDGRMQEMEDLRTCLWNLSPIIHPNPTPPTHTKSKNQGSQRERERLQAKIKSSHCIICIMRKKIPKLYIYI